MSKARLAFKSLCEVNITSKVKKCLTKIGQVVYSVTVSSITFYL